MSADENEAYLRYVTATEKARADRTSDCPPDPPEKRGSPEVERVGDKLQEFQQVERSMTRSLAQLVMTDNTDGKVYPGALFWAGAIRDGRLHQLPDVPGRPRVRTTFTGLKNVSLPSSRIEAAPANLELQPDDRAGTLSFVHDGSYSDYMAGATAVFEGRVSDGGVRVDAELKVSSSIEFALLDAGLSASYWGSQMRSSTSHKANKQRSVAVMSFNQVFYTASADAPPLSGYVPHAIIRADPEVAEMLATGAASNGEIAYVRKVNYGRRVLVSLTAESSDDELKAALNASVEWINGKIEGDVASEAKGVWKSVEGRLVVIGGEYPKGVSGLFGGDMRAFAESIQAIMAAEQVNSSTGAVPVSFELAYVDDNAPMQVFETAHFAGKIPTRSFGKIEQNQQIATTGADTAVIGGDSEVGSDDWTEVEITKQELSLGEDGRTVRFALTWHTRECNKHKQPNGTVIRSSRTFEYPQPKAVYPFEHVAYGPFKQLYAGKQRNAQEFPDCGLLSNIRVKFDDKGRGDDSIQNLTADLKFTAELED